MRDANTTQTRRKRGPAALPVRYGTGLPMGAPLEAQAGDLDEGLERVDDREDELEAVEERGHRGGLPLVDHCTESQRRAQSTANKQTDRPQCMRESASWQACDVCVDSAPARLIGCDAPAMNTA